MEVLLIDIGALALFLGYMAVVYWHGVSHESQPRERAPAAHLQGHARWL
jgi:hypothetical protein